MTHFHQFCASVLSGFVLTRLWSVNQSGYFRLNALDSLYMARSHPILWNPTLQQNQHFYYRRPSRHPSAPSVQFKIICSWFHGRVTFLELMWTWTISGLIIRSLFRKWGCKNVWHYLIQFTGDDWLKVTKADDNWSTNRKLFKIH